jgi:hypothetical protein
MKEATEAAAPIFRAVLLGVRQMMVFMGDRYINLDHVKTIAFSTRDKVDFADVEFADQTSASYKIGRDLSETVVSSTTVVATAIRKVATSKHPDLRNQGLEIIAALPPAETVTRERRQPLDPAYGLVWEDAPVDALANAKQIN